MLDLPAVLYRVPMAVHDWNRLDRSYKQEILANREQKVRSRLTGAIQSCTANLNNPADMVRIFTYHSPRLALSVWTFTYNSPRNVYWEAWPRSHWCCYVSLQVSPDLKTEKDVLMYCAYISQRKYGVVLDDISPGAADELQAVKMFADYLSSESRR